MAGKKRSSATGSASSLKKRSKQVPVEIPADVEIADVEIPAPEEIVEEIVESSEEADCLFIGKAAPSSRKRLKTKQVALEIPAAAENTTPEIVSESQENADCRLIGQPLPHEEALTRWPDRYQNNGKNECNLTETSKISNGNDDSEVPIFAHRHYTKAEVDGHVYHLEDDAYVQAEDGKKDYICKIIEMFEGIDRSLYFTAQWFYRAEDTVIQRCHDLIDERRIFFSEIKDVNPLGCLLKPLKIHRIHTNMDEVAKEKQKLNCDYFCDMMYLLPYCSFKRFPSDDAENASECDSTTSNDDDAVGGCSRKKKMEVKLLDLYSGCGAMSTGLCLGANGGGVKLVTKWAVDLNQYACESLRFNHPETKVRNESAEWFLVLLKEWESLCVAFSFFKSNAPPHPFLDQLRKEEEMEGDDGDDSSAAVDDEEVFEVEEILDICYGDPNKNKEVGLYFKIRWKGYGAEYDTWEPIDGLSDCLEKLKMFVESGYKKEILPLPGRVDVICGGPPCQGISGFNRFRDSEEPLRDEKNKQLIVYMDIVGFLKPKLVLMENVVDLVKFSHGYCGRYAVGKLVGMNYQTRLGIMAAGAYGLPQFRLRVFLWGARESEKLPAYPLPTHDVVVRGNVPKEFELNAVAYEADSKTSLEKVLLLGDAISDLPPVDNNENRDKMPYGEAASTTFQYFIRLKQAEMPGCLNFGSDCGSHLLYDHRPLELNKDDYGRVCEIPKKKGANFRDLPGVKVRPDNKVEWDPEVPRALLPSGKPLVPDYAMSFVRGTSSKPFGRLWFDETVPTVVTRAEPHNQAILHPNQNRVLTIRENARLQGFPDYYKLFGPVKERYTQVGNAVAVPVARALGYSLALSWRRLSKEEPVFTLPKGFPVSKETEEALFFKISRSEIDLKANLDRIGELLNKVVSRENLLERGLDQRHLYMLNGQSKMFTKKL